MGEHLQKQYPLLSVGVLLVFGLWLGWSVLRSVRLLRLSEAELRAREDGWRAVGEKIAAGFAMFLGVSILLGLTGAIGGFMLLAVGDLFALVATAQKIPPTPWPWFLLLPFALTFYLRILIPIASSIRSEGFAPFGAMRSLHNLLGWIALIAGAGLTNQALETVERRDEIRALSK